MSTNNNELNSNKDYKNSNSEVVEKKETIPWLVSFPKDDKITRHLRTSLIVSCRGHERIASVLDYFLFTASWEAKNQGAEKGCNVVNVTRTHKEIMEKLTFNVSRKTLIHYLDTLSDWGYVLSKPYGRTFSVQFDNVQHSINEPPAVKRRSPRQRDCQKGCKSTTCENLQPSFEDLQQKVELLQLKVVDLQLKVVTLQQKVEEPSTLQRCFQTLGRLLEDHNFSPTDYTNLLLSITNLRESSVVVSQNTTPPSLSDENVNVEEQNKNYNLLPSNEPQQQENCASDTESHSQQITLTGELTSGYVLTQPLTVQVVYSDGEYVVSEALYANHAAASTKDTALASFKRILVEEYILLSEEESNLAPRMLKQLEYLRSLIQLSHQGSEQSQAAHPFAVPPLQSVEIGTPLSLDGQTVTPPTVSVANTPRRSGDVSSYEDRVVYGYLHGARLLTQQSHDDATQDASFLPPQTSENSHDTLKPSNDTPVTSRGSQRENEASQPDTSEQAASYSQDIQETSLAAEKPAVPQLPSAEMKWCAEKLVQITEAKRIARGKVGVYFDEDIRGNSAKSQRQRQLEAAKRILAKGVTEEEYIKAYDERNDEWWNQTQGSLTVEEMAANTKNRVMRILEILEKLETMSKAIGLKQAGQGQKWNATQQQQRTERAAQENAHSAAMNGGLTYSEINRLKPAEKKAYLEKLKEQQQQKNLAAAQ